MAIYKEPIKVRIVRNVRRISAYPFVAVGAVAFVALMACIYLSSYVYVGRKHARDTVEDFIGRIF